MERMHKRVASVTPEVLQGETTEDLLTGATELPLDNTGDFAEDGGSVRIAGTVYTYSAVEEGEDDDTPDPSITLDTGLLADLPAGSMVEVWNPALGAVVVDYMVEVTDDTDGSPGTAYLPHHLIPFMPEGLPPGVGSSVTVEVDEFGDWWVVNPLGETPTLDLSYADPTTIPTQVPTAAPTSSPVVTATGLADWIVLQTEELDAATTALTFQISLDGSVWDDLNDVPVRSRVRVVKTLADGETPLSPGTVYHFRTIASNVVGTAAASAAVEAQLDQSAVSLIAQQVITAEIIAGFALLGTVHIGGDAFTLTPPGVDPENLAGGLRIRSTDGGVIHLPADGSRPILSGDALLQSLEVAEGARLYGESDLFGRLTLFTAAVPDPTVAPVVESYYPEEQLPVSGPLGLAAGLGGADWATISNGELLEVTGGAVSDSRGAAGSELGLTSVGGDYYTLGWVSGLRKFDVRGYDAALGTLGLQIRIPAVSYSGERAAIGTDGTNVVVAYEAFNSNGNWSGDVVMTRYNPADWSVVSTITVPSPGGPLGGVYYGELDGHFGGDRWVLQPRDDDMIVYNTSGVEVPSEQLPRPHGKQARGLNIDPVSPNRFFVIDNAGVKREVLSPVDGAPGTRWHSYAWVDADTHTTLTSPETEHERIAGSHVRVTASGPPQEAAVGTHVANHIRFFAAASSGGTKHNQGLAGVGSRSVSLQSINDASGGAPASNNFTVQPGKIAATTGGFEIDGDSNGSIGTGTFADEIAALAGGGDGWTYEHRATDYTNSTTTQSDVFTGFTPVASQLYEVEVFGAALAAVNTTGFQGGIDGPTGATWVAQRVGIINSTAAEVAAGLTAFGIHAAGTVQTVPSTYTIKALIQMGGSPGSGNIRMAARSEVAASQVTLKAGSYMRWRELP